MDCCAHLPDGWLATCFHAHDAAYAARIGRAD